MDYPSEHLLNSIEEIANIKNSLSLDDRSLTTSRGLHVNEKKLSGGELQYSAGGRFGAKLVFSREEGGNRMVKKYQPGSWEFKAEETLELCRTLKRANEELTCWSEEKTRTYNSDEPVVNEVIERVAEVNMEHREENLRQWRQGGLPRWVELRDKFLIELKREWPVEYAELQVNRRGERGIAELLQEFITRAYINGYMYGKNWISPEELTQSNLHLGELLARKVRQGFKGGKSRGIAFADVLAHVAVMGTVDGSVPGAEKTSDL